MFILRRITRDGLETNTCLDVYYTLILKDKNPDEFHDRTAQWERADLLDVYGLVCVDDEESIMPLYTDSKYYIMTSEGKTFSNVSERL